LVVPATTPVRVAPDSDVEFAEVPFEAAEEEGVGLELVDPVLPVWSYGVRSIVRIGPLDSVSFDLQLHRQSVEFPDALITNHDVRDAVEAFVELLILFGEEPDFSLEGSAFARTGDFGDDGFIC